MTRLEPHQARALGFSMKKHLLAVGLLIATSMPVVAGEADVPNTAESIDKGRALYLHMCVECHGRNGKSQVEAISDATDLTEPSLYRNGSTDAAIDKSIRDGAGSGMPAYAAEVKSEADIGHMRNFIKSLWPEAQRPPVVK
jgi:mono/diheme cytochrome c family protein